jgi:hypothetical protein
MIVGIEERISLLAVPGLAHMGRPGLVGRTRELVAKPSIVVYKVAEETTRSSCSASCTGLRIADPMTVALLVRPG